MKTLQPDEAGISLAAEKLREGKLVAFPTETVYGLGANALHEEAVLSIFRAKGRPSTNPLIIHVASEEQVCSVARIPERGAAAECYRKLSALWPGPLSLVLPKQEEIPNAVTAGLATVAVRVPSHPIAERLLRSCRIPIAAPSANRSNYVSPSEAKHVRECLSGQVPFVLDGGKCPIGIESTVVALEELKDSGGVVVRLLRPGTISLEQLEETVQMPIRYEHRIAENHAASSPGQQKKHYSPRTPLVFIDELSQPVQPEQLGLIVFSDADPQMLRAAQVCSLGEPEDASQACRQLYSTLRSMDELGLDLIAVQRCEEKGIGRALMDRLRRACTPHRA